MSEKRTPYKPRIPSPGGTGRALWPGETAAPRFIPADLKAEISGAAFDELTHLRTRITALETAARAVCEAYKHEVTWDLLEAVGGLGKVLENRD